MIDTTRAVDHPEPNGSPYVTGANVPLPVCSGTDTRSDRASRIGCVAIGRLS